MTTGDGLLKNSTVGARVNNQIMPPERHPFNELMDTTDNAAPPEENSHANNMDTHDDDDEQDKYKPETTVTFKLDNVTEFTRGSDSRYSETAYVRGLPWKILAMPRDAQRQTDRRSRALGFFLQCNGDSTEASAWNCAASAELRVLSQKDGQPSHTRKIQHTFYPKENDWGYAQFMTFEALLDPNNPYCKDDSIILQVYVNADAPHGVQWDSKKHTGYIGLKNQGATCYMNSILQTLFFTNKLRKAVYQIPTNDDEPTKSVALAMQRVFFELQTSDRSVGTKKLTRSFGWDTFESFLQHDVQELCRVLMDNLESKMKGTTVQDTIPWLFEGKMKSYIRCKNVEFESSRAEPFYDVQLNVKNKKTLIESFRDYVEVESLEGDNKYDAGQYGMQEAEKGVIFLKLPPVLHLQLMRFQYDPNQDANVKINDRLEFPEELDLSEFVDKDSEYERPDTDPPKYILHAVLVHSGDFHGGHYVVFINPKGDLKWCKFDDDVVSRAAKRDAVSNNYGGEDPDMPHRAYTNAYMLVYIRKSKIPEVLVPISQADIPTRLKERLEEEHEQDAARKKEKTEAHLYTSVNIVTDETLSTSMAFDIFDFDVVEPLARKFKLLKRSTIDDLYGEIENAYSIPRKYFRLWLMPPAMNRIQPRLLGEETDDRGSDRQTTLADAFNTSMDERNYVYIETASLTQPNQPLPAYDSKLDMLTFLKFFDSRTQSLKYCGNILISMKQNLAHYFPEMRKRAHLQPSDRLIVYEETVGDLHTLVSHISNDELNTLLEESPSNERNKGVLRNINDGLILVYQVDYAPKEFTRIDQHFTFLHNRIELECVDKDNEQHVVTGEASIKWTYAETIKWIAERLNEMAKAAAESGVGDQKDCPARVNDPYNLQLYRPSAMNPDKPQSQVQFGPLELGDILNANSRRHDRRDNVKHRLFFQRLPVRVDELDRRRLVKIRWAPDARLKTEWPEFCLYPERDGSVKHVLDEMRRTIKASQIADTMPADAKLRLVIFGTTQSHSRIGYTCDEEAGADTPYEQVHSRVYQASHAFSPVMRIEPVPADQSTVEPTREHLLPVAHFNKDPAHMFGNPFLIKVRQGESFTDVRERLRQTLDVSEKDFERYKFALVLGGKAKYIEDAANFVVNLNELTHQPVQPPSQTIPLPMLQKPWLGLDHMNKSRASRSHPLEKAIVIHN